MAGPVDVVVVGGRVAGSLTGLRFAAAGARVRVLESGGFPSDTLSTHFFRGDGLVRSLAEVGVLDEVLASGAPTLGCEYFSLDGGPLDQGPPQDPGDVGYCLSVRRVVLDDILIRRAQLLGVDVRTHTRVVDLVTADGRVVGVADDSGERHLAPLVVGADGRRSAVGRLVAAADEERHAPARAMYYRYATGWRPLEPVGPEFLLDGDRFTYAFPSDHGTTCLAVSVPVAAHADPRVTPSLALEEAVRAHPSTAERLDRATWVSGVFTGLPSDAVWRQSAGPGWALVGDAATSQDPWAGAGMDSAARQAEALVEAVDAAEDWDSDDWTATYQRLSRERCYQAFAETTMLATDLRQLVS